MDGVLVFRFQFAKRLGPFTGRFGIRESTGGIGLDLHLLGDRFELRQDLFGFGEEISPRWRVAVSYEFLRTLWLLGGVDISYGVYIYHFLIINVFIELGWMQSLWSVAGVFVLSLIAGATSWIGVEKRSLTLKSTVTRTVAVPALMQTENA